ncbi:Gp19/Gp15/Gp42 family protein [Mycolicibacterium sp. Y3]
MQDARRDGSDIERMILRRIPDLAAQIEADDLEKADVVDIDADAVLRVIRNPEGLFSEQEGSHSHQLSREAVDSSLRIPAEEWELPGVKPSPNFTIVARITTGR